MGGKKKVLDRAHYHVDNGGITFKFVETIHERESDVLSPVDYGLPRDVIGRETKINRRYYAEIQTTHFGSGVTFRVPLGNPNIVSYLIHCLTKVQDLMVKDREEPTDGYEFAYRDNNPLGVTHRDGKEVDGYWPPDSKRKRTSGEDMLADAAISPGKHGDLVRQADDCVRLARKEHPKAGGKFIENRALELMHLPWEDVKKRLSED